MSQNNPRQLNFAKLKPLGYPSEYRQTRFTPTSAIQSYTTNDIVRFLIQSDGVWDPYGAFIEIEIQYNDTNQQGVALQIDNSAQSIINQLIITTNGQEIERIEEYDTIAAMLYDVNLPEDLKGVKIHEGIYPGNRNNDRNPPVVQPTTNGATSFNTSSFDLANKKVSYLTGKRYLPFEDEVGVNPYNYMGGNVVFGMVANGDAYQKKHNPTKFYTPNDAYYITPVMEMNSFLSGTKWDARSVAQRSLFQKLVAQDTIKLPDADNASILETAGSGNLGWYEKYVGNLLWQTNQNQNGTETTLQDKINFCKKRAELGLILNNWIVDVQGVNSKAVDQDFISNYSSLYANSTYYLPKYIGYQIPYSASLSQGYESFLSSVLPQGWFANGKFQTEPVVYRTKKFTIPLLSCIFGIMLPKDNYKYIPLGLFNNLLFEFRLNPYAFFTSGPIQGLFTDAITVQSSRNWQINKFEIWADIYFFDSVVMGSIMSQAANEGLYLQTSSWILGPQFPITNTSSLKGTWQVNMGFESLRMLAIIFLLNDYAQYSYCRKQFRISQNITQLQLKFGTKYYPPQPIQGHGGNYQGALNNSQFYQQFQKCFGKLNNIYGECAINPINWAINERPYDVTDLRAHYTNFTQQGTTGSGNNTYTASLATIGNINTTYGLPWFHENRVIGKCIYAINLETFPNDDTVISGMNTLTTRPFEIQINTDDANGTNRSSNMYVFCYADIIYKISKDGVQVLGK